MIKKTMQEWSNFANCYTAVTVDSSGGQRLHFFINKPVVTNLENLGIFAWRDDKHHMVGTLTQNLFIPFEGDWRDSLCIPIGKENGEKIKIEIKDIKNTEWVIKPSYSERQAKWVKENNLKTGNKIKFVHIYKPYQDGFEYSDAVYDAFPLGTIHTIKSITENYIELEDIYWPMPYLAFELI